MDYIVDPIAITIVGCGSGDGGECFFEAYAEIVYFFGNSFSLSDKTVAEGGNTLA
jgi:hypothetical protein